MKELSIEQKAKAYDEAIRKAESLYKAAEPMSGCNVILETMFPELAESQDEKIRKELINLVKKSYEQGGYALHKWEADEILAWLERHGQVKESTISQHENKLCKENNDSLTNEDEKVRIEILNHCKDKAEKYHNDPKYKNINAWITWLEKQCNQKHENICSDCINRKGCINCGDGNLMETLTQKPANKVEPKFHKGEWITNGRYTKLIVGINSDWPYYMFKDGTSKRIKDVDRIYHLWSIADIKQGDMLADDTIVLIVDHLGTFENRPIIYSWYYANSNKFYGPGPSESDRWEVEGFHPATKEQCDSFISKMKAAGYEWDIKNKKLIKL